MTEIESDPVGRVRENGKELYREKRDGKKIVSETVTDLLPIDKVIEHRILLKRDQFWHLEYQEPFRIQQPNPLLVFHPLSQFFPVALWVYAITIECVLYPENERFQEEKEMKGVRKGNKLEWEKLEWKS